MKTVVKLAGVMMILTALAITAAVPFIPSFMLKTFASAYGLDLRYGSLKSASLAGMAFDDLSVVDRSRGIGISSKDAKIRFIWNGPDPRNATLGFNLNDVRFIKTKREAKASSYDTLDGLVAMPFGNDIVYDEIAGKVRSSGGNVTVSDFMAKSDLVRLSVNGTIKSDNTVKSDIVIYFADEMTKKIPPELTKLVLNSEDPGWKSLSVKLEGNYAMPTIQVSSRLFRLSIGVKE